jgi:site-specific DNA-methyltransferase (adenine-specific)
MRYLCRLVTPPGGTVLDVFAGSGTTGVAAIAEGFSFVGCELGGDDGSHLPILVGRVRHALGLPPEQPPPAVR